MEPSFLTPTQLADRWHITVKTLSQWRWNGQGPCFSKVSRRVVYCIHDVEDFERLKRCRSTAEYHKFTKTLGSSEPSDTYPNQPFKKPLLPNKKG